MGDRFYLTAKSLRRLAGVVRWVERRMARRDLRRGPSGYRGPPYKKHWYRIATNDGDGAYTVVMQQWSDETAALADLAETSHHRYGSLAARDLRGAADGLISQIVPGWEVWTGAQWQRLIDVRSATPPVRWAKASADWTSAAGNGSYVACHPCDDRDGTNEDTDTSFDVYLPRTAGRDPNVRDDEVIGYAVDPNGARVCVTDYLDDKIGTIKWWSGAVGNIPPGWALCDGASGTVDLSGRFIMCLDADGEADENEIGDAGGFRTHGATENNHDDHAAHTLNDHNIGADLNTHTINDHTKAQVAQAIADHPAHSHSIDFTKSSHGWTDAGTDFYAHDDGLTINDPDADQETTEEDAMTHAASAGSDLSHSGSLGHSGTASHSGDLSHAAHTDTDNRPPYYVLAAIQRIN